MQQLFADGMKNAVKDYGAIDGLLRKEDGRLWPVDLSPLKAKPSEKKPVAP